MVVSVRADTRDDRPRGNGLAYELSIRRRESGRISDSLFATRYHCELPPLFVLLSSQSLPIVFLLKPVAVSTFRQWFANIAHEV